MTMTLPLKGIRVLDLGHTVMGPSAGMILADLGAEVVKIEQVGGEPTRRLRGFGAGYFGYFNRNKRSVALDLKQDEGRMAFLRLVDQADVVIENFGPGAMERLGLGETVLRSRNARLIYASLKGFMPGPYESRMALDEVVQMMTGLAYMTGPPGQPLRAGTSVVDITGGMFAVIGILGALITRQQTNHGTTVQSSLFETAVFLMGQHLCNAAQSDTPIPPMPARVSAWAVYEIFELANDAQLFVGLTSDQHWQRFCQEAGLHELAADPALADNNSRIRARPVLIPQLKAFFSGISLDEGIALCARARIPFSPIRQPEDLFEDEHLLATGGLLPVTLPGGQTARLPALPILFDGQMPDRADDPPMAGADTQAYLAEAGYSQAEIHRLKDLGVIGGTGGRA